MNLSQSKNPSILKFDAPSVRAFYFLLLILFLGFFRLSAQNEMFIEQLSNRLVTRENFDKNNILINKQIFKVDSIKEINGYYEIKIVSEMFNNYGKSLSKYSTIYRCKPNDLSIMVMAFPFSNPNSKETKIRTTSKNFKQMYNLKTLDNIQMEINFDSGLLNFFGSKSIIEIYDRVVDFKENKKIIESKLIVKVYAFGFKLKQLNYSVIEKMTLPGFLYFQKFTEKDGSFFTISYR